MPGAVPISTAGASLKALVRKQLNELERNSKFLAMKEGYEHAVDISPVDLATAVFNINPSAGTPEAFGRRATGQPFGQPPASRVDPIYDQLDPGVHAYVAFHALDRRGVFDYAGIMLEDGWSDQARTGVMGPTAIHLEQVGDRIARQAEAATEAAI